MDPRHARGARAERLAERMLEAAGLRIVDRNVRLRGGEIDLVCRERDTWVFVEVKARRPGWDDAPGAAVSWTKRRRLVRLAEHYLKWRRLHDVRCRFDVVEVTDDGRGIPIVRHLPSAFDASAE
jgi:putative endonuclease